MAQPNFNPSSAEALAAVQARLQSMNAQQPAFNPAAPATLAAVANRLKSLSQPAAQPSLLERAANNPITNTILNIGGGLAKGGLQAVSDIGNIPKLITSKAPTFVAPNAPFTNPQSSVFQTAQGAGQLAGLLGTGEVGGLAKAGAEIAPALEPLANALTAEGKVGVGKLAISQGLARRALGNALIGAGMNAQNPTLGAATGGITSLGLEGGANALGSGLNLVGQGIRKINPSLATQDFVNGLTKNQDRSQVASDIASDIHNTVKQQKSEAGNEFNIARQLVLDNGNRELPLETFNNLNPEVLKFIKNNPDLNEMQSKFNAEPTYDNAHLFKQQIGHEMAALKPAFGSPDAATRAEIKGLKKSYGAVGTDIQNYLEGISPQALKAYNNGTELYKQNVIPYYSNPTLGKIADGKLTNPKNIENVFKFPSHDIQTVLSQLPDETKDKIMGSALNKQHLLRRPDSFLNAVDKGIKDEGLDNLVTGNFLKGLDNLQTVNNRANTLQDLAGIGLGTAAGMHINPESGAMLGALMGHLARKPLGQASQAVLKTLAPETFPATLQRISPSLARLAVAGGVPNYFGGQ